MGGNWLERVWKRSVTPLWEPINEGGGQAPQQQGVTPMPSWITQEADWQKQMRGARMGPLRNVYADLGKGPGGDYNQRMREAYLNVNRPDMEKYYSQRRTETQRNMEARGRGASSYAAEAQRRIGSEESGRMEQLMNMATLAADKMNMARMTGLQAGMSVDYNADRVRRSLAEAGWRAEQELESGERIAAERAASERDTAWSEGLGEMIPALLQLLLAFA